MIKSLIESLFKEKRKPMTSEVRADIKGSFGELRQEIRLDRLPRESYKVINNILIPNEDKTCQIDHLVISIYGIFVIENKNYQGDIYGSQFDKTWTKVMGNSKHTFYNPIAQNFGHIKTLSNIIGEKYRIHSLIVFSDRANLKKIEIDNKSNIEVINEGNLLATIERYREAVISEREMKNLYNEVLKSMGSIRQDMNKHVKDIKANLEKKHSTCPKCESNLVKRSGKYGEFLGCSSFPKCKYTYKI